MAGTEREGMTGAEKEVEGEETGAAATKNADREVKAANVDDPVSKEPSPGRQGRWGDGSFPLIAIV
jgi:hypothetical protein